MRLLRYVLAGLLIHAGTAAFAAQTDYIKAVTYFGSAWPLNFWNAGLSRVDSDFVELRDDGFNAVIVVVPWGEFSPGVEPVKFNEDAFTSLARVCTAAKRHGLKFFMRVSYLWDMYPGVQKPDIERSGDLIAGDSLMPAWSAYLSRVASATRDCSDGAFISWEDFWHSIDRLSAPVGESESAALSRALGFDRWIRSHAPEEYRRKYETQVRRLGSYPVPNRRSPDFRLVFQWFDEQFTARLMPELAANFGSASLEARVDGDPIYDGDKLVEWYSHQATYKIQSSRYLMTYWAPAMGARNNGEVDSVEKVVERFSWLYKRVAGATSNKLFMGQFLFLDNTPSAARNAVIDPTGLSRFLIDVAGPMTLLTSGYALWGNRDYHANIVFNGVFALGRFGWVFGGGATVSTAADGRTSVRLPAGAMVRQNMPYGRDHFRSSAKATTLSFRAEGPGIVVARYAGVEQRMKLGSESRLVSMTFPTAVSDSDLVIGSQSGALKVSEVNLHTFTQISKIRDAMGQPSIYLSDILNLNREIDRRTLPRSTFLASDGSLTQISGVFDVEQGSGSAFAWAGPDIQLQISVKASPIIVRGEIRPSMFKVRTPCTIDAVVNGVKSASTTYQSNSPVRMDVPVPAAMIGSIADLRLLSNCKINPREELGGTDRRTLAFILQEINASAPAGSPAR